MDKKENRFVEQDAPAKNTDNAFVKVGEDGKPEMPVDKASDNNSREEEAVDDDERAHH